MATNTTETRRQDKRQADGETQRREPSGPRLDAAPVRGRPANENDPATSMMMAKLRRKPSSAPFAVAGFVSLFWVFGWFAIYSNSLFATGNAFTTAGLPETFRAVAL